MIKGFINQNERLCDIVFLVAATTTLQIYFLSDIGFYSDDWAFLGVLTNIKSSNLFTFIYNFYLLYKDVLITRPIQIIQLSTLYWFFGTSPLGYHISNLFFLILLVIYFYLSLNKLQIPRIAAFTIPLIYTLLPHYSTTRIWLASFNINVSTCFFFINLYASIEYIESISDRKRKWQWMLISLLSLAVSILAYEVIVPLFAINFFVVWWKGRNKNVKTTSLIVASIAIYLLCILFKVKYSTRIGGYTSNYLITISQAYKAAAMNDFYIYGVKLPKHIWHLFQTRTSEKIYFIASAMSLIIFLYLIQFKIQTYTRRFWLLTILTGAAIYITGYLIFLTANNLQPTPTGINNRVTTTAAIGVATCFFGSIGLLSFYIKNNHIKVFFFSFITSILCGFGYIINCTVSTFFSQSYISQLKILDSLRKSVPKLTAKNTLILDGICPYLGPAPIFDCEWDLAGALQVHYRNMYTQADVRTNRLTYNENGLTTITYGKKNFYSYNRYLIIYNNQNKKYFTLNNFKDAKTYFTTNRAADIITCSEGREGYGTSIF
ncbi:hypothetical protein [Hymenobacter sp. HDW8]|uniref:hypothetical protein n=1 Tax=Hymenobacter sp. HDW8 TaxID=2714932 RepID=UPI00140BE368|nr:hypothetical protein [Hymenobacter sp. HDW8]QIL76556.1 hypothetical protein G7064_12320 [Hymenobacter sp. HDW8]